MGYGLGLLCIIRVSMDVEVIDYWLIIDRYCSSC